MKKNISWTALTVLLIATSAFSGSTPARKGKGKTKMTAKTAHTAILKTSMGDITIKLFGEQSPKTVENFVGLATGSKDWKDPKTGKDMKETPLYNETIFHRVIPGFMIQGGDPTGTGRGDPGYRFADEFNPSLSFDRPGLLAMANAGPNTNGSQFFITAGPTPHLNNHHTIFGEVTSGMDVIEKIINAPRDGNDRPKEAIKINTVTIE